MAFHIPAGLGPELYPLSWLVGTWRGEGTIGYHDEIAHARVLQEVAFTHDGGPYLAYRSTTWLAVPRNAADAGSPAPADGSPSERGESGEAEPGSAFGLGPAAGPVARGDVWHTESGYWRVVPGQKGKHGGPKQDPPFEVESLVADPAGYVTIYAGQVDGARIDLATDLLARV
ncbi:MAG: FABP family protein, partial [Bifidobacteriaceae bacterium]|nr:FABP family protein [Bifidobacteriaceae bacterium]